MPEGPEIKKEADFLNSHLENKVLKSFIFFDGRYKNKKQPEGWNKFTELLPLKVKKFMLKESFYGFLFIIQILQFGIHLDYQVIGQIESQNI